ncbi:hypothetical protein D3C81_891710 [compost metagenome]
MAAVRGGPSGRPGRRCPGFQPAYSCHLFVRKPNGAAPIFQWSYTMKKPTPNPPESDADTTSPYASVDSKKLHEAADRALDFYLNPSAHIMSSANEPEPMYLANPRYNTESLLANASETLGSASEMLMNFAASLETSQRKTALGIAQVVMLGELAVNQALDHVELKN